MSSTQDLLDIVLYYADIFEEDGRHAQAGEMQHIADQIKERDKLMRTAANALERAQLLHTDALPKFNWGASGLDAYAIRLLNEVPGEVNEALMAIQRGIKK